MNANIDPYVINRLTRIGDRVKLLKEDDIFGQYLDTQTKGTVIGYHRYSFSRGRNQLNKDFDRPGIYSSNGAALVKWDDGIQRPNDPHVMAMDTSHEEWLRIYAERQDDKNYNQAFDSYRFERELPKFKYMEGMRVLYQWRYSQYNKDQREAVIQTLNYLDDENMRYNLSFLNGGTCYAHEDEIGKILDHGNYWRAENNEPLIFKDLKGEVEYHRSIGKTISHKCPRGSYSWTIEEITEGINTGVIDFAMTHAGLFGAPPTVTGYVIIDNDDLKQRVRAITTKNFTEL